MSLYGYISQLQFQHSVINNLLIFQLIFKESKLSQRSKDKSMTLNHLNKFLEILCLIRLRKQGLELT